MNDDNNSLTTALLQPNITIVDVREKLEYIMGHIDGAINIPLRQVLSRIEEFAAMQQPIIVYCRSGNRSQQAKLLLNAKGLENIHNGGSLSNMKSLIESLRSTER